MLLQTILLGFLAPVAAAQTETTCQPGSIPTDTPAPQLKLPWGIWTATCYQPDNQIFLFKNVRFGAVPQRFGRSITPDWLDDTVQEITQDISCIQLNTSQLHEPPGGTPTIGNPRSSAEMQCEDCLYLDIYVPVSAFQSEAKLLPVVVWFYGGGFALGSKNPMGPIYTGQSILNASNYQTIFIAGNYRLGAFGWLAGDYMQAAGQPNAGFYDQALLLEWVRDYVHLIQGDKARVSAWGESAGAGSILHHLIREDGEHDPLFNTFVVQSPAFQWAWDNSPDGELDNNYRTFSNFSGCGYDYNIDCLRDAALEDLILANQELFGQVRLKGFFPVGPAVDGVWIKSIPAVRFSQGYYWRGIQSAIISHCANESHSFTPNITTQDEFNAYIDEFLPGPSLEDQRVAIKERYNCAVRFSGDFRRCLATVIQDSMFTCNTRDMFEAYPDISYMMQYAFPIAEFAYHATDLVPLFTNNKSEVEKIAGRAYAVAMGEQIPRIYKNYFASFAITGNPNKGLAEPEVIWPIADGSSDRLSGVMNVSWAFWFPPLEFRLITDNQNAKSTCSFWTEIAKDIALPQVVIDSQERVPFTMGPGEL
ncbi:carboxylesterase family protein [Nemania abortiva]|nr:carboxylesterase family protein [Nemania abortiva]